MLGSISNARRGRKTASLRLYELALGTVDTCTACGAAIELREMPDHKGRPFRYWSNCPCIGAAADRAAELALESNRYHADQRTPVIADPIPIADFTFETFEPARLKNGPRLLSIAQGWLAAIERLPVAPSYNANPRACLYFYSPGKGRGKTHLASALVNAARADGRRAVIASEVSYVESYWAADFAARKELSDLPGDKAWLTVLDDLGQKESTTPGLRDAWYDILNPRWLKRGWLVVTSNWTPDELVERGTLNEASYSRLTHMTQGRLLTFDGADQRLSYSEAA